MSFIIIIIIIDIIKRNIFVVWMYLLFFISTEYEYDHLAFPVNMPQMIWHQGITWTSVDFSSVESGCGIHLRAIPLVLGMPNLSVSRICGQIAGLKLLTYLLGDNELNRVNQLGNY